MAKTYTYHKVMSDPIACNLSWPAILSQVAIQWYDY